MNGDVRGWRLALVPDDLLNPPEQARAALPPVLGILESSGYGVIQMPPSGAHALLLAVTADQIAEYAHHGYAVAAVGLRGAPPDGLHWRRLSRLLRERKVAAPPRHWIRPGGDVAAEGRRLSEFLAAYDLPLDEQRHWRV